MHCLIERAQTRTDTDRAAIVNNYLLFPRQRENFRIDRLFVMHAAREQTSRPIKKHRSFHRRSSVSFVRDNFQSTLYNTSPKRFKRTAVFFTVRIESLSAVIIQARAFIRTKYDSKDDYLSNALSCLLYTMTHENIQTLINNNNNK